MLPEHTVGSGSNSAPAQSEGRLIGQSDRHSGRTASRQTAGGSPFQRGGAYNFGRGKGSGLSLARIAFKVRMRSEKG